MNPIIEAINTELEAKREARVSLDLRAAAIDAEIAHLEQLLELSQNGPVVDGNPPAEPDAETDDADLPGPTTPEAPASASTLADAGPASPTNPAEPGEPDGVGDGPLCERCQENPAATCECDEVDEPQDEDRPLSCREAIDIVLPDLIAENESFTTRDVVKALEESDHSFTTTTIGNVLKRKAADGALVAVRAGGPGRSSIWSGPSTAAAAAPAPDAGEKSKASDEQVKSISKALRKKPAPAVELGPETTTLPDGRNADEVVFAAIEENAPIEYHRLSDITGIFNRDTLHAALARLEKAGRVEKGDDGAYRYCLVVEPKQAESTPPGGASQEQDELRSKILDRLRASNGSAGSRTIAGLLRVDVKTVEDELHRMEAEDLVNYRGLVRQWRLVD